MTAAPIWPQLVEAGARAIWAHVDDVSPGRKHPWDKAPEYDQRVALELSAAALRAALEKLAEVGPSPRVIVATDEAIIKALEPIAPPPFPTPGEQAARAAIRALLSEAEAGERG